MTRAQLKARRLELEAGGSAAAARRQQAAATVPPDLRRENCRFKEELAEVRKGESGKVVAIRSAIGSSSNGQRLLRSVRGEDMKSKRDLIAVHAAQHAVRLMCLVLSVSLSWFHTWRATAPRRAARHAGRNALAARVREIVDESEALRRVAHPGRAGGPRGTDRPEDGGQVQAGPRILRENGIRALIQRHRMPSTTNSGHTLGTAPTLLRRDFYADAPDRV